MHPIRSSVNVLLITTISASMFFVTSSVEASSNNLANAQVKPIISISNKLPYNMKSPGPIITNISDMLNQVGYSYYQAYLAGTKQSGMYELDRRPKGVNTSLDLNIDSDSVTYDLQANDVAPIYIGENVFHNKSTEDQTFSTASYTKSISETTSVTTTKGFSIGGSGKLFSIPIILAEGLSANAQFDSSKAEATTNSVVKTLIAPPQQVKVPAHKTYIAVVNLEQKNFKGALSYKAVGSNMRTNISATGMWVSWTGVPDLKRYTFNNKTGDLWNKISASEKNKVKDITMQPESNTMKIDGQVAIDSVAGSKLTVSIYDADTKQLKKRIPLPAQK
ncbi:ETX/MTX2 family pore-forming toxin [Paenilisteria newyorkensis]|uniref:ETX/MTX2 family pore-forming toxin n=1 Tax=Listeria newyorkensis TaxID=1497681 RepID=UPI000669CF5B|nr:ETX/MTX2 family pore-forming toxin [Listeria newyorkensis]KMT61920.1 hypothetical protein X559_1780 [Listeria newyorkensis]